MLKLGRADRIAEAGIGDGLWGSAAQRESGGITQRLGTEGIVGNWTHEIDESEAA